MAKTPRRVRTQAGVKKFGLSINSIIEADLDTHSTGHKKGHSPGSAPSAKARLRGEFADVRSGVRSKQRAESPGAKQTKKIARITDQPGLRRRKNPYLTHEVTGGQTNGPEPLSNAEYNEHTAHIEKTIKQAIDSGQATEHLYATETPEGRFIWAPERKKLHDQIIERIWAGQNADSVPNEGKAVIAGGLGGAGKSTVLKKYAGVDQSKYITVNPDDVKEVMAEMGLMPSVGGLSPMETSALVHEESSDIAMLIAERAYAEKKNIIWDITMSSGGSVAKRLEQLKKHGYTQVDGVFVDIPVETSVQRALARHRSGMERFRNGTGLGGRYVPPAIIRKNESSTHSSKNREVFDSLHSRFTNWGVWDNSGKAPVVVEGKGRWEN